MAAGAGRLHAEGSPKLEHGVLHGKEGAEAAKRLGHPCLGLGLRAGFGIEHVPHVPACQGEKEAGAAVDGIPEDGAFAVEIPAHAHLLGSGAGEEEAGCGSLGGQPPFGLGDEALLAENLCGLSEAGRNGGLAEGAGFAAGLEGAGDVGKASVRMAAGKGSQALCGLAGGFFAARGQGQDERPGRGRRRCRRFRRLLDDKMAVGAAEAEGADSGPAGLCRPGVQGCARGEAGLFQAEGGIWPFEVEQRRDFGVLEAEHGLDEAGRAGGRVEMADVGLHGAELAGAAFRSVGLGQRLDLDGIAHGRARAVGFDVGDAFGRHVRHGERLLDDGALAADRGRREADLVGAVVVHGEAPDDAVDVVAGLKGVLQALQDQHGAAVAEVHAAGPVVEGVAVAVGGEAALLEGEVACLLGKDDGASAGKRHVAAVVHQALAGLGNADEGAGAGSLHGHGRPVQVQLVGDARSRVVLVAAEQGVHVACGIRGEGGGLAQPSAGGDAGEDADARVPGNGFRRVAGIFKRLPGRLEQPPLLGVDASGLSRRIAEAGRVEGKGAVQDVAALHVAGIVQQAFVRQPFQIFPGKLPGGVAALAHRAPELLNGLGAGKAARHADDGYAAETGIFLVHLHSFVCMHVK